MTIDISIIGGTGIYEWKALEGAQNKTIKTPYGLPSAPITIGHWHQKSVAFLPRHGKSHELPPHAINYRANVYALKSLGASRILSVNAVGGINDATLEQPHIVIPDQIIDYTHGRIASFFHQSGDPLNHVDFTFPFCETFRNDLIRAAQITHTPHSSKGTYGCTQGPRLETRAEIDMMEQQGCDIVGMTAMPEAALARELDLQYASLSIVVNPAAGKSEGKIELEDIKLNMSRGVHAVKKIIDYLMKQ